MTMDKEVVNKVIENADGVALQAYKDGLQRSVKPLGDILSLFPRTLRIAFIGWEKWLTNREESLRLTAEAIEEKVKQIPEEKIIEPESYIAIPAIQQLSYCQNNDDLRELYANLLVSSMNIDKKWMVHPAFVDIIKQLTPDEARIINSVGGFKNNFLPLIDVKGVVRGDKGEGHQLLITNFTTVGFDVIENKESICSYVDNLVRLNLFEIPPSYYLVDNKLYDALEQNPILDKLSKPFQSIYDLSYNHKILVISNLGLQFKKVCCQ